jgi:uroporphyrinogen-III synthase
MALAGKKVALAECRLADELAALFTHAGAHPVHVPLVAILDAPDAPLIAWITALAAGTFSYTLFLTGEGVRRRHTCAQRAGLDAEYRAGLARTRIITRGPKPVVALRELDVKQFASASKPTTDGVIETLRDYDLAGQTVGVQRYVAENAPLSTFLLEREAVEWAVLPYVYAPDSATEQVVALIEGLIAGQYDVLVITSSPQIARLKEVADERGLSAGLEQALTTTPVAAVGPIAPTRCGRRATAWPSCPNKDS